MIVEISKLLRLFEAFRAQLRQIVWWITIGPWAHRQRLAWDWMSKYRRGEISLSPVSLIELGVVIRSLHLVLRPRQLLPVWLVLALTLKLGLRLRRVKLRVSLEILISPPLFKNLVLKRRWGTVEIPVVLLLDGRSIEFGCLVLWDGWLSERGCRITHAC